MYYNVIICINGEFVVGKYYSTVQIEEHYAVVGEPGKIILKCNFTITSIFNTVEPGICFEEQIV